jgi:hypothetical protein
MSNKYLITLSNYSTGKLLYFDEPIQKKPNIHKLFEQLWQITKGGKWDEVTEIHCNLRVINPGWRSPQ